MRVTVAKNIVASKGKEIEKQTQLTFVTMLSLNESLPTPVSTFGFRLSSCGVGLLSAMNC
jgi:hypothetical protein